MKFTIFFLSLFFTTLIAKESYQSATYRLKISDLYNLYDQKKVSDTLNLANGILVDHPQSRDTLLVLGNIYFYRKFYDLALNYYLKNLDLKQNFLFNEGELELLEKIASCYLIKKKFLQAEKYIKKLLYKTSVKDQYGQVLKNSIPYSDMSNKKYYYEAHFFLGNIFLWKKDFYSAQEKFNLCLKENYYSKLIYLLLSHYLIIHNVTELNLQLEANNRTNSDKKNIEFSPKKKREMLKYYYQRYFKTQPTVNYYLLKDEDIVRRVNEYFVNLKKK